VSVPGWRAEKGLVVGILASTQGAEDTFIHMRLADAQRRFDHPSELTHILVRLADPNDLDSAVNQLRACDAGLAMNVVPLAHVFRTIQSLVDSTRVLLGCIAAIALLVAGAGVSNTILMAVSERRREIGVMRAMGASRLDVFRLIWAETLQTCVSGAVLGVALAFIASRGVEAFVRSNLPFAPTDGLIRWQWSTAAGCLSCALLLGCLAAFLPAWRAASVPPMMSIRNAGGRA
jgi:putative ABC transport system permease protein